MATSTLPSGLIITDRRHQRAHEVPQIDPHGHVGNGNAPSTVGPESVAGREMMGSWHAEAWDGWPEGWQTPYAGEMYSGYGYGRGADMWGRVSTAMTCADLNSRQLASFPTYGVKGQTPFTLPEWSTNPEPSLYSGWSEFMHGVVNCLELRGESFQYVTGRYGDGRIARFVNLNPDAVGVEWIDGRLEYLIDGDPVSDPKDICHIKYQSWPGVLRGIGPLAWLAHNMNTAFNLEQYASNLASRGGVPWAVLQAKVNLENNQARDTQNAWVAASRRRDGAPAVIGNAFELKPLTLSPRDMALLEIEEFSERRICAGFGVPGFLVNVATADGMTYSNVTQVYLGHWASTLRPLGQTIAEPWSNWLLPRGSRMEFNPDRYIQPPLAERVAAYVAMFNLVDPASGERAMTLGEIRSAERLAAGADQPPGDVMSAEWLTGART